MSKEISQSDRLFKSQHDHPLLQTIHHIFHGYILHSTTYFFQSSESVCICFFRLCRFNQLFIISRQLLWLHTISTRICLNHIIPVNIERCFNVKLKHSLFITWNILKLHIFSNNASLKLYLSFSNIQRHKCRSMLCCRLYPFKFIKLNSFYLNCRVRQ